MLRNVVRNKNKVTDKSPKPKATASSAPLSHANNRADSETDIESEPNEDCGINLDKSSTEEKLNFLCKEISQIKKLQLEVTKLKKENMEKDVKIKSLESRLEDLEQYTRRDDLVISGMKMTHKTYSRAASSSHSEDQNDGAPVIEEQTLECKVVNLLNKCDVPIKSEDISACHTIGIGDSEGNKPVVIRLINRKLKFDIFQCSKMLREKENVYINEHLTKLNSAIARQAIILRRHGKISATWTRNCRVYIKTSDDNEHFQIHAIRNIDELTKFN